MGCADRTPAVSPRERAYSTALGLVAAHGHAASRRELVRAGVPRWYIRNEIARRRWRTLGRHVVLMHNGPIAVRDRRRAAVLEAGPRAALDGVTALQEAGITGLTDTVIEISAPKGTRPGRLPGTKVRETRWFRAEDVVEGESGVRRTRPAVAAVHAAMWAKSDRQATLFVVLVVQQGRATPKAILDALTRIRRRRRVAILAESVLQIAGGSQSLGELDVVGAMRGRGLPLPSQQVVRIDKSGREYLDCAFHDYRIVLEIDGAGHAAAQQVLKDLVRDLGLLAEGRSVVRIPLVAWVLDHEAVLDALEAVFRSRGWLSQAA